MSLLTARTKAPIDFGIQNKPYTQDEPDLIDFEITVLTTAKAAVFNRPSKVASPTSAQADPSEVASSTSAHYVEILYYSNITQKISTKKCLY